MREWGDFCFSDSFEGEEKAFHTSDSAVSLVARGKTCPALGTGPSRLLSVDNNCITSIPYAVYFSSVATIHHVLLKACNVRRVCPARQYTDMAHVWVP